eukprot:scaffold25413_cov113-Cylindrotheca_fusiformis.AAC.3
MGFISIVQKSTLFGEDGDIFTCFSSCSDNDGAQFSSSAAFDFCRLRFLGCSIGPFRFSSAVLDSRGTRMSSHTSNVDTVHSFGYGVGGGDVIGLDRLRVGVSYTNGIVIVMLSGKCEISFSDVEVVQ